MICGKARRIYNDLKGKQAAERGEIQNSRVWLDNYKKQTGIHSVVRHGEAASSDSTASVDFVKTFALIIAEQIYIPQQVFHCHETGLFWKKMPRRTFIMAEKKRVPGHIPMTNWLNLALCANASCECKVKPLLVYRSENPRAFQSQRVFKGKLQMMWRTKSKAWVTRHFFTEWVNLCFGPAVKKYLTEKNLPMKCLMVLNNDPGHPPGLKEDILDEYRLIKVLYLPPNTTPQTTWKKLWPVSVTKKDFEVFDTPDPDDSKPTAVDDIVSLVKPMGLEVDEADVNDLVEEHQE
ncbi:tigger transposable element-derived protein 1-like [Palaemon carinicauda]|uniref:tigger transposable element-derived protein 1-like n=1 Tax=Palaemon carinicauda TaxID=392227 RepID=UPI0035B65ACC